MILKKYISRILNNMKYNAKKDSFRTPQFIIDYLKENYQIQSFFDPCPYNPHFDPLVDKDGLSYAWNHPYIFCNPPFSRSHMWLKKCIHEVLHNPNVKLIAFLCKPGGLCTQSFAPEGLFTHIIFFPKALQFLPYTSRANFKSCVVVFRKSSETFGTFETFPVKDISY